MLLSLVNMKLRDEYDSLEALAEGLDEDAEDIKKRLEAAGFKYNKETNQFR